MNFNSFFKEKPLLSGGDFSCMICRNCQALTLSGHGTYPMLFVLQGEISLDFPMQNEWVKEGHFTVVNHEKLCQIRSCKEDTVILQYNPPPRLTNFFKAGCSAIFQQYMTPVPILPPLWEWIESLLEDMVSGSTTDEAHCHRYCKRFASIIMDYPSKTLYEMYIPFYACTRLSCKDCRL